MIKLYTAPEPGVALGDWAVERPGELEDALLQHGALLFRGFGVDDLRSFERARDVLIGSQTPYVEKATPRSPIGEHGVYTSTEFPASQEIALHNENSYATSWPGRLLFACFEAPSSGGATSLADVRKVLADLPKRVLEPFVRHGWMLRRTYGTGFGLPWQTAFDTESSADVDAYCAEADIETEWLDDGGLRTRQVRPAVARHPVTGELVWFNHVCFWHDTMLDPDLREMMLDELGYEGLPYSTSYGDGQPIDAQVIEQISRAYRQHRISHDWRVGDALLIDNMLVAHARERYAGRRRVVVAMGRTTSREQVAA